MDYWQKLLRDLVHLQGYFLRTLKSLTAYEKEEVGKI